MNNPAALSACEHQPARLPRGVTWAVVAICAAPFLLNLVGFDFGSAAYSFDAAAAVDLSRLVLVDTLHHSLAGSFLHTILEWSALCTAVFTVILAWVHFGIRKNDVIVPVIGVCLLCAGCMDAFHTLAATRLIQATANNTDMIPFTWALCRSFNALIMICGIGIVLWRMRRGALTTPIWFVGTTSLAFGVIAYVTIHFCAISDNIPQTMYPDAFLTRPFDVAPLVMFVFAGAVVYRRLHRVSPSFFTSALILSAIPEIAVQLHMAFGSTALFDNHFNIAHFLKIIAYLVPFAGLCMDYYHSHRAAERLASSLAESEMRQRAILGATHDPIITTDSRGIVQSVSDSVQQVFGWKPEEVVGQNIKMLMPEPFPTEHDGYIEEYRRTGISEILGITREAEVVRKDGSKCACELSISRVDVPSENEPLFTGIIRDISERILTQEAIQSYLAALEQSNVELTDTQQMLEQTVSSLEHSNKELDDFAYIASHDLKEPLRGMHNYSTFLLEDYADKLDDDGRSKLETLTRLSQRMESLIEALLYYSRIGRVDLARGFVDLNDVLGDVLDSLHITLVERGIEVRMVKTLPTIECDRVLVGEALRNLITNAMKYNDKHNRWVEIGFTENEHLQPPDQQRAGGPVLYVRDNGIGIPKKHLDSVFRIFKRLHGRDKYGGGTGAGLTIVKKIIDRHGGKIWVESTPGEGTTFYFTLSEEYQDEHADRETHTAHSTC